MLRIDRLRAGDEQISAGAMNRGLEAIERHDRTTVTGAGASRGPGGLGVAVIDVDPDLGVPVINKSGHAIPVGGVGVLSFTDAADYTTSRDRVRLPVRRATVHGGASILLVNCQQVEIKNGSHGFMVIASESRPVWVAYDDEEATDPVVGEPWGPKTDTFKLGRGIPGFQAISPGKSDVGLVLCVRTPQDDERDVKLTEQLYGSDPAEGKLYWKGVDTGNVVSVTDSMIGSGYIPTDKWVTARFWGSIPAWKVLNAEC